MDRRVTSELGGRGPPGQATNGAGFRFDRLVCFAPRLHNCFRKGLETLRVTAPAEDASVSIVLRVVALFRMLRLICVDG